MDDGRVGQGDGGRGEELPDDDQEEDEEEDLQETRGMTRILEEIESKGSLNDRCQLKNLNRKWVQLEGVALLITDPTC